MRSAKDQFKAHRRQLELERRAGCHRAELTRSEALLWERLRGRKLGAQFRRQVPVCGRYIADFLAPAARLVVEVDGSAHVGREVADARRDRVLAREGYRTLRIGASLVFKDLDSAVALVVHALGTMSTRLTRRFC